MSKVGNFVIVALILLILAVVVYPASGGGLAAIKTIRLSNVKQLAIADDMYASDNNGHLPPMEWRPALRPYTKNEKLFEDRTEDRAYIFAHRATLIGTKLEKIPNPEEKALLFDVIESSDPYVAELPALAFRSSKKQPSEVRHRSLRRQPRKIPHPRSSGQGSLTPSVRRVALGPFR